MHLESQDFTEEGPHLGVEHNKEQTGSSGVLDFFSANHRNVPDGSAGGGSGGGEPAYHTETQTADSPLGRELGYMEEPALPVLLQPQGPRGRRGQPQGRSLASAA